MEEWGRQRRGRQGHPLVISSWWGCILPSQLPHQALVQVSILGVLTLVVLCYRVSIYCVRQPAIVSNKAGKIGVTWNCSGQTTMYAQLSMLSGQPLVDLSDMSK